MCCGLLGGRRQTREFGTFTRELLELADWLRACGVTHVALESTGVLGPDYLDRMNPEGLRRRLTKRLKGLRFKVTVEPLAEIA